MTALAPIVRPDPFDFELPQELVAADPVEAEGLARHDVRLLVASRSDGCLVDTAFRRLPEFLEAGDLVVVNTSATLAAAVPAGPGLVVHLATELPGGLWLVELRKPCRAGSQPFHGGRAGQRVELPGGASVELLAPFPADGEAVSSPRLWFAALRLPRAVSSARLGPQPRRGGAPSPPGAVSEYLAEWGRPIRYGCPERAWPLSAYQTLFAQEPGSAEMPSAGRPFSPHVVDALRARGVSIATVVLHAGVSSPETGEPPAPERYRVPAETAAAVNATRAAGRRVIAVGTTVTRALETEADEAGLARAGGGWTDLVIGPERGVRVVDGLLTGWHEPRASHLQLLEAVAGRPLLERSYAAALAAGYRWHEFGDVHLILP